MMGDVDPEDTKSHQEENNSSNSDMVHLEREEAEMLEEAEKEAAEEEKVKRTEEEEDEDDELQTSVLSVLGGEKELVELREDEEDLQAPETELLVSAEEPHVEKEPAEFRQVPPVTLPPLPIVRLDPPSTTSTPVPSTTSSEVEELYSTQGLLPPSILTLMATEPPVEKLEQLKPSQVPLSDVEEHSVKESQAAVEKTEPRSAVSETRKPLSSTELLCGGAVLVAVVGVVAYGAVAYCRK